MQSPFVSQFNLSPVASERPYMTIPVMHSESHAPIRVIMNPVKKNSTWQERTSRDEVPMLAMQEINKILCHLQQVFNCIVQCDLTSPNIVPNDEYGREVSLAIVENFWFPSLRIKRCRAGRQLFLILLTSLFTLC